MDKHFVPRRFSKVKGEWNHQDINQWPLVGASYQILVLPLQSMWRIILQFKYNFE